MLGLPFDTCRCLVYFARDGGLVALIKNSCAERRVREMSTPQSKRAASRRCDAAGGTLKAAVVRFFDPGVRIAEYV